MLQTKQADAQAQADEWQSSYRRTPHKRPPEVSVAGAGFVDVVNDHPVSSASAAGWFEGLTLPWGSAWSSWRTVPEAEGGVPTRRCRDAGPATRLIRPLERGQPPIYVGDGGGESGDGSTKGGDHCCKATRQQLTPSLAGASARP